ncbi:uncharacterized protein LOC123399397 [Hordeum vulgare subsp. vulgare]|uniref:uncharacterized protein LOC123399397 n=1 Tax=Hordeum vulgare subsp. vulgare TaxID=112509 RepID=UPI001D1A5832|nr:uncharacterized protein LOC123399397 [Hordeum vulgare subsp. vulgare]
MWLLWWHVVMLVGGGWIANGWIRGMKHIWFHRLLHPVSQQLLLPPTSITEVCTSTTNLPHRWQPHQCGEEGPGAASSSSSEEDPPGRCVPGATPLEWPLANPRFTGLHRPGRRPACCSTARGTMCEWRGTEGPLEVLAMLLKTSPRATVGVGRRSPRLALDEETRATTTSCVGVGDGRREESGCACSAGSTGSASSWTT